MASSVPRTALRARSRSAQDALAKGLGYFSIALGMTELFAPGILCEAAGLEGQETLVRAYGAREVATGVAILASHDPTPWIWGRVAGDAADVATVAAQLKDDSAKRKKVSLTLTALIGIAALDVFCARGLQSEKGGRKTASTDYSSRSGFPGGIASARGAARNFQVPEDMRVPESLRSDVFERRNRRAASGGASETRSTGISRTYAPNG